LSQLPNKDGFFEREWREFPVPPLEIEFDESSHSPSQPSERKSALKGGEQIDTLPTNRKGASNVPTEYDNNQNIGRNQFEFSLRDKKGIVTNVKDQH